ncbi:MULTISPECIES: hypothetical protein [Calothrix]|uniref:Uncharacterized protein n=2 Tax=Calothrix TaxID=1186 RepID=A0ABR8ANW9_9CYAN|nr:MULTISPECIES: hypothetical protein [Calothrix]MBD2200381.1 hypothetical protein [Calothrix parietina FACHB-288]MBD2229334.1 hypothetical protein [Calothrix anomala FACHB-343]
MNHFNLKSLTFYGIAIGSVLLLFKTVSVYGESKLKAPPTINNHYRIALQEAIPNCGKPEQLILNMQQSGIYLNASFLPANPEAESSNSNPTHNHLSGIFSNQELNLSGRIDKSVFCQISNPKDNYVHSVKMQMQLINQGNFIGQFSLSGSTRVFKFTAVPDKTQVKSQQSKKH